MESGLSSLCVSVLGNATRELKLSYSYILRMSWDLNPRSVNSESRFTPLSQGIKIMACMVGVFELLVSYAGSHFAGLASLDPLM